MARICTRPGSPPPYLKQKPTLQSSITDFTTYVTVKKVDNDQLTKVLKFFISGNITFNEANNPYFQDLIWTAHGTKNQPINRKNVWERLSEVALTVKEDLMISLMENESKVSLALDCWLSKNGYAFLGKSPLTSLFSYCTLSD